MTETQQALREQLDSLDDLNSIVRTMKALAAASIRQYEQAVEALSFYERNVELGLGVMLREYGVGSLISQPKSTPQTGASIAIIFGSDHGLCGRFNEQIADYAINDLDSRPTETRQHNILTVGMRLAAHLQAQSVPVHKQITLPSTAEQITATVQDILQWIEQTRGRTPVPEVILYANQPGERLDAEPSGRALLPLDIEYFYTLGRHQWPSRRQPTAFMDTHRLASSLIREHLFVRLFQACAGSQASEQASRLSAMQSAESSLEERIDSVTNAHRRLRQDAITSELLDIVAGFEATQTQ